jgi:phospholipid transport system transporter-binding protein
MANPQRIKRGGLSAVRDAPAIDAEAAFIALTGDSYRIEAALTFATVPALRQPGLKRIRSAAAEVEFDLQHVAVIDSAGLALLIDWLAEARAAKRTLRYAQAPEALRALARLSDVESLIAAVPPRASISAAPAADHSR